MIILANRYAAFFEFVQAEARHNNVRPEPHRFLERVLSNDVGELALVQQGDGMVKSNGVLKAVEPRKERSTEVPSIVDGWF